MAIESTLGIESVVSQMRSLAQQASSGAGVAFGQAQGLQNIGSTGGRSFADELSRTLNSVAALQNQSSAQARAYQAGEPGVSLNDVMVDMQKSSIAFQATLQARNRLVAAYQEIASMPV